MAILALKNIHSRFTDLVAEDRDPRVAHALISESYRRHIETLQCFPSCRSLIPLFETAISECPSWNTTSQAMTHFRYVLDAVTNKLFICTRCNTPHCYRDCYYWGERLGYSYKCYECLNSSNYYDSAYMSD